MAEEGREPKALLGDVQIDRAFYIKGLPQTNNIAILTNIIMNQERDQAASVALDGAMVVLGGLSHNPIDNITNLRFSWTTLMFFFGLKFLSFSLCIL